MFSIVFYKGFVVCSLCSVLLGFKYAFLLSCFIVVLRFVAFCSCFIVGSGLQVQICFSTVVFYSIFVVCSLCGVLQGFKYAFFLSCFIRVLWSAHCVAFCLGSNMPFYCRVL